MSKLSGAQYLPEWTDLIAAVREVYHGELTYSAATDEASHVSFWSQLDTISVKPIRRDLQHHADRAGSRQCMDRSADQSVLRRGVRLQVAVDFLHSLSLEYGKPVLIVRSRLSQLDGTAINPGGGSSKAPADAAEQADAYNAFMQVWTRRAEAGSRASSSGSGISTARRRRPAIPCRASRRQTSSRSISTAPAPFPISW